MKKTTLNILTNAFTTIERTTNYNVTHFDRKFSTNYIDSGIEDLRGYLATLYKYGTMKEKEFEEAMEMVTIYRIKMNTNYGV